MKTRTYKYSVSSIRKMLKSLDNLDIIHETQNGLIKTTFEIKDGILTATSRSRNSDDRCEFSFNIEKNVEWLHKEFGNATNFINAITYYCYVMSDSKK